MTPNCMRHAGSFMIENINSCGFVQNAHTYGKMGCVQSMKPDPHYAGSIREGYPTRTQSTIARITIEEDEK